jgi:hypothetical protein
MVWNPIKGLAFQLWKANLDGSPKLPIKVPSLVLYCPIWGHDAMRLWRGKSLSTLNCLNMWNYKNKALNKVLLMQ